MDKKSKITKMGRYVGAVVAVPFIVMGVSKFMHSSIPFGEYVVGAIVAGFVLLLLWND